MLGLREEMTFWLYFRGEDPGGEGIGCRGQRRWIYEGEERGGRKGGRYIAVFEGVVERGSIRYCKEGRWG